MRSKRQHTKRSPKDNYFKHFFSVFTVIFLVMTVIILQVLNVGIYASVDKSLYGASQNINQYVTVQLSRLEVLADVEFEADEDDGEADDVKPKFRPNLPMAATTDIILYNAAGHVISQTGTFEQFYSLPLDDSKLGSIVSRPIKTHWEEEELYRTMTVRINNLLYPEVAFATILINTDQLEASHARTVRIIVSIMVFFWIISLFASVYLAHWTRQPILESFERQKAFVENASHELRTPLAVLQNRLEGLFRKPDETILDNSERIAASLEEVRNMKLLTTNLLNLARRDDGLVPDVVEVPPSFFDQIFSNYQLIAEEQNKQLVTQNQVHQSFRLDKVLMKQLLTILFDNAIKYTDDGGKIWIRVYTLDKQLLLDVTDDGPGIPDKDKGHIFDRFYRVDKARTRQKGGFGLGLSLAQQIVTALGGSITVSDNSPKGSQFSVRLPQG